MRAVWYYVYELVHVPSGKKYIGVSQNPSARFGAHRRLPPLPMRSVVSDFDSEVVMNVLSDYGSKHLAHAEELRLITVLGTATPNGFNTVKSKQQARMWTLKTRKRQLQCAQQSCIIIE